MTTLFDLAFWSAAPFWALMILAPARSWTKRIVASPLIVLPTLVVWAVAAVPLLGPLWTAVTNPSVDGLRELLGDPGAVTHSASAAPARPWNTPSRSRACSGRF